MLKLLKLLLMKFVKIVKIAGSWSCIDIDVCMTQPRNRTITTALYSLVEEISLTIILIILTFMTQCSIFTIYSAILYTSNAR